MKETNHPLTYRNVKRQRCIVVNGTEQDSTFGHWTVSDARYEKDAGALADIIRVGQSGIGPFIVHLHYTARWSGDHVTVHFPAAPHPKDAIDFAVTFVRAWNRHRQPRHE